MRVNQWRLEQDCVGEYLGKANCGFGRRLDRALNSGRDSGAARAIRDAGTEVLKPGYQVLMNMDWFGQHWVLGARDIEIWLSMRNITIFLILAVPLAVLPALVLSSVLASRLPGMKVFRTIYFIPSVAGVVGVALVAGCATTGYQQASQTAQKLQSSRADVDAARQVAGEVSDKGDRSTREQSGALH